MRFFLSLVFSFFLSIGFAQVPWLESYNVTWTTQSDNSMQSMPCGGAGLGLNVWVENNQLYILIGSPDSWLETPPRSEPFQYVVRKLAKVGRLRLQFPDSTFVSSFKQVLDLSSNSIIVQGIGLNGQEMNVKIWTDYYSPIIHVEGNSNFPAKIYAHVDYWRGDAHFKGNTIEWGYRNESQQYNSREFYINSRHLAAIADSIPNLFSGLAFGGILQGDGFCQAGKTNIVYENISSKVLSLKTRKACTNFHLQAVIGISQEQSLSTFFSSLRRLSVRKYKCANEDWQKTVDAWNDRWSKSYICINKNRGSQDLGWQVGRNYQLFRAMLAVNNKGRFPTLFNGGPFTCLSDPERRRWDWSEYMGQNQRLVYWPMLRSGDLDLLDVALNFYKERTPVCATWAKYFWNIEGHLYPEDMGAFGLPAYPTTKDGFSSPDCLTYHFTSGMEFALMMLERARYTSDDVLSYLPSVIGILKAFDGFYQRENIKRTGHPFDQNNKYVIYPGNGLELYTDTRNESATIAGLMALSDGLLDLPDTILCDEERDFVQEFKLRLPQIPMRYIRGHQTIAPAESWAKERAATNMEMPHLYPLFPFGLFTVGRPGLNLALDTWKYGCFKEEYQRRAFCWYQGGIFTARLGMAEDAREYAIAKFLYPLRQDRHVVGKDFDKDITPERTRYPAFWDTGSFCEIPDMDHGGSAMVGLQEMLLQTELPGSDIYGNKYGRQIYLFPAWPKDWDVDFKLYAPYNTVVECSYKSGKIEHLKVIPEERMKDVIIMLK